MSWEAVARVQGREDAWTKIITLGYEGWDSGQTVSFDSEDIAKLAAVSAGPSLKEDSRYDYVAWVSVERVEVR